MSLSDELYKEVLLDHYQNPRNYGEIIYPDLHEEGVNPLCGDEVELFIRLDGDVISEIRFRGKGCSISQASASMLTECLLGKNLSEAKRLLRELKANLLEDKKSNYAEEYSDLDSLEAVKKLPARIKCAVLPWNTLEKAVEKFPKAI
ncbi:SUF system NifU family Fe-S cluster assembly protein [Leptospira fletcheri]|uniref:SUF system NifU family Fe-S cluster assembly protein n=1 Tax=Leptospira fletcheri TaxID=2484981 RepID=A0A4R9GHW2_9LEPT|nr:SUF system NifU family Fe-S cluster assembly protein [Leptospira fletcheri]TGK12328.1 SUF system NifU family Fe-S cluster assembly protein [Leptospira fletcheri]